MILACDINMYAYLREALPRTENPQAHSSTFLITPAHSSTLQHRHSHREPGAYETPSGLRLPTGRRRSTGWSQGAGALILGLIPRKSAR